MTSLKKLSNLLKQDRNQRILYGIGLLVWIIFWITQLDNIGEGNLSRFLDPWLIIPPLLLIGQLLFNNKIIWALLIGFVSFFSLLILYYWIFLEILIDMHRDYAPNSNWDLKKILDQLIILTILILVNWIFWKIKPNKNTLHNSI